MTAAAAGDDPDGGRSPERYRRDLWAMVPAEVVESDLDDACVRLFAFIDRYQQKGLRGWEGYRRAADRLPWQPEKVRAHAQHLADLGLIRIEQEGNGQVLLTVLRNAARDAVEGDALPAPTRRRKSARRPPDERAKGDPRPDDRDATTEDPRPDDRDAARPDDRDGESRRSGRGPSAFDGQGGGDASPRVVSRDRCSRRGCDDPGVEEIGGRLWCAHDAGP